MFSMFPFRPNIPVLCYHRVGVPDGMALELFRSHLQTIQDLELRVLPLARLVDIMAGRAKPEANAVVLTFDDCTVDHLQVVAPELTSRNMPGTFFAVSDFVADGPRRSPEVLAGLLQPPAYPGSGAGFLAAMQGDARHFLNAEELRSLERDFGHAVQAHSCRHQACFRNLRTTGRLDSPDTRWGAAGVYFPHGVPQRIPGHWPAYPMGSALAFDGFWPAAASRTDGEIPALRLRSTTQRAADCLRDALRCKARLEEILERPETVWCWPWGHYDAVSLRAIRQAGFSAALTLDRGANVPGADPMGIRRIGVAQRQPVSWLRSRLRLYRGELTTRIFFKRFVKKDEITGAVFVSHSDKASGGSRQMLNNAVALAAMGLRCAVVCPAQARYAPELRAAGVRVEPMSQARGLPGALALAWQLRRVAVSTRAQVIHAFHGRSGRAALLARLLGSGARVFFNRGVIYPPNPIYALWTRLGAQVICNSQEVRRRMRAVGVPAGKVQVVLNAYAPLDLLDPPPRQAPGPRPTVLCSADLSPVKGLDVFLAMVAEMLRQRGPDVCRFQLLGAGREEVPAAMAGPAVLNAVEFLGYRPHEDVLRAMGRADVLVIPSRQESLPNVLLEAFGSGTPVVATAVGGIPDLLHHGSNGLLATPEDPEGLAREVLRLLDDDALARRFRELNLALVHGYLHPARKARMLLRVYSGEALVEEIPRRYLTAEQTAARDS